MLKTILITVLIVAICIALLSVKILLREKGIGCIQSQDREARRANPHAIAERKTNETKKEENN